MSQALWQSLAEKAGLTLTTEQDAKLHVYLELLLAANERMNLTRITELSAAEILHVGDALTLLPHLPARLHRLADVGSGGGVPGIVLAIVRPDVRVTLIESTQKKAAFLIEAAAELKLSNVTADPRRAEDVARSKERESFEIVVARAVAVLPTLVGWLLPLTRIGGYALAMKGPKAVEELKLSQHAITQLGGGKAESHPADVPGTTGHVVIKIPKVGRTPERFPQKV